MTDPNFPPWPSLGALLRDRVERHSDRELFRFEGRSRSFEQVEAAMSTCAVKGSFFRQVRVLSR